MLGSTDFQSLPGTTVVGTDGDKIGTVNDVYADESGEGATFVTVNTGLFGTKSTFVPLAQASLQGDALSVPYSKAQVKDAPSVNPDEEISPEEEQRLYAHYGLAGGSGTSAGTTTGRADSDRDGVFDDVEGRTVGHDTSGPTTDQAMTRSEERLHVGTERVETGRARLRKYIVTENVQQTVPVSREEVRIEREPITDGNVGAAMDGPALSEEEHEVVLSEERPVVNKETVPVERVRLDTATVTEQAQVNEQVAREEIDTEGGVYPNDPSGRSTDRRDTDTRSGR